MLAGIRQVAYYVSDLDGAKRWYCSVLDSSPIIDAPFMAVFRAGEGLGLSLLLRSEGARASQGPIVYWGVADVDVAYRRLLEAGATSVGEPREVMGSRIAQVADPFGNVLGLMSPAQSTRERGVDRSPSETALSVAFMRAMAAADPRVEVRGTDSLARLFLPEDRKALVSDAEKRSWTLDKLSTPGVYEYMLARSSFFDELVGAALDEDIPQIVFLGAGYDSRPYRFRDRIRSTRLFEIDAAPTQARKREILRREGVEAPPGLAYAAADLGQEPLASVLERAGCRPGQRTLFVWEGVIYYLVANAVDATLRAIKSFAAPGSQLGFDYVAWSPDMANAHGVQEMREAMTTRHPGEPIRFRIQAGGMERFLVARGFALDQHLDAHAIEHTYLRLTDGTLAGSVPPVFRLAVARTLGGGSP